MPSASLRFASERFDYQSELPDDANAGNRFYGHDVADFLVQQLGERGIAAVVIEEDWGWLVSSRRDTTPRFDIAIYNLADHGEGGRPGIGEWGLWLKGYETKKAFGLLSRTVDAPIDAAVRDAVMQAIRAAGAEPLAWEDAPDA
jgi:hypothetical protein